jgi:hypothetical protein
VTSCMASLASMTTPLKRTSFPQVVASPEPLSGQDTVCSHHAPIRRPHLPQQNLFVTLDASDYSHIASVDVEKTIYDLALDVPDPGTAWAFSLLPPHAIRH